MQMKTRVHPRRGFMALAGIAGTQILIWYAAGGDCQSQILEITVRTPR
jgi:hypothetical protein